MRPENPCLLPQGRQAQSAIASLGDTGLEPGDVTPCNVKNLQNPPKLGDAFSDAFSGNSAPDLPAELMQRLSELSAEDKAKLADMLKEHD